MPFVLSAKFPGAIVQVSDLLNLKNKVPSVSVPTLNATINSSVTTFSVAAGGGAKLPADNFTVTIDDEIIFVGSRSTDSLSSCIRGHVGSSAASHLGGADVNHFIIAETLDQMAAEIAALESFIPAFRFSPDQAPASPGSLDDEFAGSVLNTSSRWTKVRTPTTTVGSSRLFMVHNASEHGAWCRIYQTVPATPWEVTAKLSIPGTGPLTWRAGLFIEDAGGHLETMHVKFDGGSSAGGWVGAYLLEQVAWSDDVGTVDATKFSSGIGLSQSWTALQFYMRFKDTGTAHQLSISLDGINFSKITDYVRPYTPTRVGLATFSVTGMGVGAVSEPAISCDWFRRTV